MVCKTSNISRMSVRKPKLVLPKSRPIAYLLYVLLVVFTLSCHQDTENTTVTSSSSVSGEDEAEQPGEIKIIPGFEVEMIYETSRDIHGTWVRLIKDESGRMIVSDEDNAGMFWIKILEKENDSIAVDVQRMILPATGAQGLTWFDGELYANVNGKGLFRMSDTDDDQILDNLQFLKGPQSPSDHGNHALVPAPDGSGIYVINGNHTPLPEKYSSRVANWAEDILLPRQWDARGHAAGVLAPGGYVALMDKNAQSWEILSTGYRNAYDMAIHPNGDKFIFDSDMEWDMGMPWYRPTRILHVVSGSDYGWRSGSGKWKAFYEDSHPSVLDVGPASPTGLLFGTGARFPEKYQKALFGLDWTYGTIYAFHLEPDGASYSATAEEFLSGHSLAVVDAVIGNDGAMYFITGGWGNDSKLYRVTYKGDQPTALIQNEEISGGTEERSIRKKLEVYHGRQDPRAVALAWPYLAHEDRFTRNAARVAIEFQPVSTWIDRAKSEIRPQAIITSTVAMARSNDSTYLGEALEQLRKLDFDSLESMQKLGYLRALSLVFMRLGVPDQDFQAYFADQLLSAIPQEDERVNVELVRLLVYLKDARVIQPALDLIHRSITPDPPEWGDIVKRNNNYGGTIQRMLENPPPINKLEFLFMLRNLESGWTLEQRKDYFQKINEAADAMGGESYWGFLERMRDEAALTLSESDRMALSEVISAPISREPPFEIQPVAGPGREWTVDKAMQVWNAPSGKKDFELGRNSFFAASCASCHRFDGMGGNIGPDLSSVSNRFSTRKILEDIIHPSETISDLYGSSRVLLTSGRHIDGLVVEEENFIKVYSRDPDKAPEIIPSGEIQSIEPVSVSQMPEGLINGLNSDELRSLIAYLQSGGDEEHEVFD